MTDGVNVEMWGEENYNHDYRKRAKGLNFGGIYGLSYYSIAEQYKVSLEEAKDIHKKFWDSIPEVARFQQKTIREAKRSGTCYNYFGRPRRVRHWLSSHVRSEVGFGERTCKNSPIQSAGADIMKMAMIKVYKRLLTKPKYKDKVKFLSSVHDEINLSINYENRELFEEMFKIFYDCMYLKIPGWVVEFDVGLELGTKWGDSFGFKYTKDWKLVPDMEYRPRDKTKVIAPKVEETKEEVKEEDSFGFDISF